MPRVQPLSKPWAPLASTYNKELRKGPDLSFGVSTVPLLIKLFDHLSNQQPPVLDPVMGDQGRLYVNDDVVPAYKRIIHHADLILPNQFEAE